ncbi:MAG: SDR family oxidoreductase [Curvibacter sp.]
MSTDEQAKLWLQKHCGVGLRARQTQSSVIRLSSCLARSNCLAHGYVAQTHVILSFMRLNLLSDLHTILDKLVAQMVDRVPLMPLRRFGQPEEVTSLCAFLAFDEASHINGAVIEVAGGLTV